MFVLASAKPKMVPGIQQAPNLEASNELAAVENCIRNEAAETQEHAS